MSGNVRCAHCRMSREDCEAAVADYRWHAHWFSPTAKENWFDCPLCADGGGMNKLDDGTS